MAQFVLTAQLQLQAPNNVSQVVNQIQNQLNGVTVNVQAQGTAQANRQIQQLSSNLNTANSAASNLGRTFAVSFRRFTAFAVATRTVSLFTNTLSKAVEEAIDFERQLVKISQVTGTAVSELRGLTDEVTKLSTGFGVSSKDLLNVAQILAQAGLSAKDTKVALDALAKTALSPTFDDISETAEGAIAILAQFKLGVAELESQLGSINAVAGKFAVESGDLIQAIRRVGGVFKASGGDLNELIALFTSVRATTRESAESIATGLRTIFTRIQRPKTIEFLKQFGVELVDLEGKFVGPFEAVRRLSEALTGLGEGDITFIRIAEELGGFRQIGKVLPLLQQFQTAQEALNVAQKGSAGLAQDAATAQQALAIRITKVKEEFLALVRGITETSSFQLFANTALNLASSLIKLADALKPIIPLLAAVAAVKIARGLGDFIGGFRGGLGSRRGYNSGGKVLKFARGGMVPGSGNRDTVPAMLQPGEFVIRKSSVNKLGAGNLAAMNENRYGLGGETRVGAAILKGSRSTDTTQIPPSLIAKSVKKDKEKRKQVRELAQNKTYTLVKDPLSKEDFLPFNSAIENGLIAGANEASKELAGTLGVPSPLVTKSTAPDFIKGLNDAAKGNLFETLLTGMINKGIWDSNPDPQRPFDFAPGTNISSLQHNGRSLFPNLNNINYVDAKASMSAASKESFATKIANQLYNEEYGIESTRKSKDDEPKERGKRRTPRERLADTAAIEAAGKALAKAKKPKAIKKRFFGGIIQNFAKGGMAQPIVDDILSNAPNAILPKPQLAIQKLIDSGGGFVDIDRTLKRTIGDQAYARARTEKERQAVLNKYFVNSQNRLNDIKTAGLTQFGTELQNSIKSGQLSGSSIRIISKSPNTPGVAEYLSGIFGIPSRNFAFTSGRSKVPLMRTFASGGGVGTDTVPALLTPGEFVVNKKSAQAIGYGALNRMNKVGKYASGGVVQRFANGGMPTKGSVSQSLQGSFGDFGEGLDPQSSQKLNKYISALSDKIMEQIKLWDMTEDQANLFIQNVKLQIESIVDNKKAIDLENNIRERVIQELATINVAGENPAIRSNNPTAPSSGTGQDKSAATTSQQVVNADKARAVAAQQAAQADLNNAQASNQDANSARLAAEANTREAAASDKATQADLKESSTSAMPDTSSSKPIANFNYALYAAIGALSAFTPNVDKNSTVMDYFQKNIIETANQLLILVSILESFGGIKGIKEGFLSLVGGIKNFKNGIIQNISSMRLLSASSVKQVAANNAATASEAKEVIANNIATASEVKESIASGVSTVADTAEAVASSLASGPILALIAVIVAGIAIFYSWNKAVADAAKAAKESAIERGDIKEAGTQAVAENEANKMNDFILAVSGVGLGLSFVTRSLRSSNEYFKTQAEAQAQATKTTEALNKASGDVSKTMEELDKGTISVSDALNSLAAVSKEVGNLTSANRRANALSASEMSTGIGATFRDIFTLGGLAGESSSTRNQRLKEEIKQREEGTKKAQEELLKISQPVLRRGMEQQIVGGGSFEKYLQSLPEDLRSVILGNDDVMEEQKKSYENLTKEIERNRKAAEAMNLGLRAPTATAGAMSSEMQRLAAQISGDTIPAISALNLLSSAASEAGAVISENSIKEAIGDVSSLLNSLGASQGSVDKFTKTAEGFATAQKEFDNIAADIKGLGKGLSPEEIKEEFAKRLGEKLPDGIGKQIQDIIAGVQLSPEQIKRVEGGDLSVFQEVLTEKGKEFLEPLIKIAEEYQKAQSVLIDLTKKQIDAQRNYVSAIQEAQDLIMEGRDIQARYGGAAVSMEERRSSILTKANARNNLTGLGNLQTGSAAELSARSREISARFAANQKRINEREGAGTAEGERIKAQQEDLKSAQKEQIQTIRELVKLEEENLKLIGEKNKLEKDSIDALISGDIDKFFEMQAAQGAKAAIATGNVGLQQAFGASALGAAAQDIKRQQEAGVQTLFGQQLGGQGGLTERAFGSALGARGVQDIRMAQVAAGTTAEEEASKARLRDLGGALGEAGQLGAELAQFEVEQATFNVKEATIKLKEIAKSGIALSERQQAAGMARGGVVYANNGIFVPRGTDTVPAMLTPGEFVVRREAVQRGNNLQILRAMNNGSISSGSMNMSRGGSVNQTQYLAMGGFTQAVNNLTGGDFLKKLTDSFNSFVGQMNDAIGNLNNTSIKHKIDTTNINHNFNGLSNLREDIKKEILGEVGRKLSNMSVGDGGRLQENKGVL